ncbi:MAG: outer membrane protein assembly factor BamD [Bacteroidales bacterium]|nr:outer membrane protein assembly factor BamD [Bacteroidales bacterium]
MAKKAFKILVIIMLALSPELWACDGSGCGVRTSGGLAAVVDTLPKAKKEPKKEKTRLSKRVTFESFDQHYERALKYYNNRQWLSAAGLFEELYPLSLGTPRADTILYLFALSYYQNGDYNMSAFHFRDYVRRYPNSERTEDAFYYCISAVYKTCPEYYLDQSNTDYAIEQIKTFVQAYPNNSHIEECNQMLDDLRLKLAKKDLEVVKLYYDTDHYEACQIAAANFFNEYSYSPLMPEAIYYLVLNNLEYAKRSTERKKPERYKACLEACQKMSILYPESKYSKDVAKIAQDVTKQLEKYNKKQS